MPRPLTPAQDRFCREYLVDLNGSAAYRRAYPGVKSEATARANAARLLANANVAARVTELSRAQLARGGVTADRVIRELAFIAFQRAGDVYRPDGTLKGPSEWDEATAAVIAGVETEEGVAAAGAEEGREPQAHGGALKRTRGAPVVRTRKVKRWDKGKALELFMRHFGLLKEDAPHPDRPAFDLDRLSDDAKRAILDGLRLALGRPAAGDAPRPAGGA